MKESQTLGSIGISIALDFIKVNVWFVIVCCSHGISLTWAITFDNRTQLKLPTNYFRSFHNNRPAKMWLVVLMCAAQNEITIDRHYVFKAHTIHESDVAFDKCDCRGQGWRRRWCATTAAIAANLVVFGCILSNKYQTKQCHSKRKSNEGIVCPKLAHSLNGEQIELTIAVENPILSIAIIGVIKIKLSMMNVFSTQLRSLETHTFFIEAKWFSGLKIYSMLVSSINEDFRFHL